ncbi:MAG TPA: ATP-grasp domain-containing protein, partial [Bdellovibrionales bacterium]|nr:ATP-grasp domain-containing protein [Bdellovibrionales bacterium]
MTKDKTIGILGGGQLARMMVLKAYDLGLTTFVLSENKLDPAAQVCTHWIKGSPSSAPMVRKFLAKVDVATFESEFLDADLLGKLSRETKTPIHPSPKLMATLQDRLPQKELLLKHGLPTSPFVAVSNAKEAEAAFEKFDGQIVFKRRRFGYDGYGTFVVRNSKDLRNFTATIAKEKSGFIGEKFVAFERELAIVVGRSHNGDVASFPFVETFQENSRCLWVKGPLAPTRELGDLSERFTGFLNAIKYVGVMGIELFETRDGLLINELAPRVHNSAHYSLDATSTDQFSMHLKCVLGMKIEKKPHAYTGGFAMLNLLGRSSKTPNFAKMPDDVKFHWYGKT